MSNLFASGLSASWKQELFSVTQNCGSRVAKCARAAILPAVMLCSVLGLPQSAKAQVPALTARVGSITGQKVTLSGSMANGVRTAKDAGRLAGSTQINGMTLHFTLSAAQQADLNELLRQQHDASSPLYHQWLTPQQYEARFGLAASDVSSISDWLQSQGFTVEETTPLRIRFSGAVSKIESAFSTEMHNYNLNGQTFFANATNVSLPATLNGVVSDVGHLNSLRPHPMHRVKGSMLYNPNYTSSTGTHFTTPADIATIYDINPIYTAGYTGAGQTLVIVGQSAISTTDVQSFHSLFGGNTNLIMTLVPNSGSSAVIDSDDEGESDLDIEYSGSIAKDAIVNFVYTGTNTSYSVFDSIEYAITNKLAPVISVSYGACEPNLSTATAASYQTTFAQANAQGQTIFSSSGDSGATGCDHNVATAADGLAIQFPADAPSVTAIGGTEFNEGSGTYWDTTNSKPGLGSALGYIPEMVWNDSDSDGLASGGGGVSTLYTKPSWQVAAGVPADGARDVPDISLDAASAHDAYFFCPAIADGQDCSQGYVYEAGGTSFSAPIVAAIQTLINQSAASTGQGNLNTILYPLAASTPAAFHDTTVGNNKSPCTSGTANCPAGTASIGYSAGTGYDLATGLGSIDAAVLAKAFTGYGNGTSLTPTGLALAVVPAYPTPADVVSYTVKVAATTGTATPTGSIQLTVDGVAVGSYLLSSGASNITYVAMTPGFHRVGAKYAGNSTYATSASAATFTVSALPATDTVLSVAPASVSTATPITVTANVTSPTAGTLTGTMQFSLDGTKVGTAATLTSGAATYTGTTPLTAGRHVVTGLYSGSATYAASTGLVSFLVSGTTASTTAVTLNTTTPSNADSVVATAKITSGATGTVQFSLDGTAVGSAVPVASSQATYTIGQLTAGSHTITAAYSGDSAYAASTGSATAVASSTASAFTLSATSVTMGTSATAASTVTVTSTNSYQGTVQLAVSGKGPTNACYAVTGKPSLTMGSTATTTIQIYTGAACVTTQIKGVRQFEMAGAAPAAPVGGSRGYRGVTFAGVLALGLLALGRRKRFSALLGVVALIALSTFVGCSSSSGSTTTAATPVTSSTGTFTLTVTGTDITTTANTATTTFALTIQ